MTNVLVLYYSSYGHIEQMADAVAAGAQTGGASVHVRRVAETVPADLAAKSHYKTESPHPVLDDVNALTNYDAIIVGVPTRYGRMPSQMAAFWDKTGALWMSGALNGKVGGAFSSTASQHGGQETTLFSVITNLMHMGMTIVGLDYGYKGQSGVDVIRGGSPYGATTTADGDGSRQPTEQELSGARYQGQRIAETAAKLKA